MRFSNLERVDVRFLNRYGNDVESDIKFLSIEIDIEVDKNEVEIHAEGELDMDASFALVTCTWGIVTVTCRYSIEVNKLHGDVYPPPHRLPVCDYGIATQGSINGDCYTQGNNPFIFLPM